MTQAEGALFATVTVAHLLAVASPGPDFAIVVRQSLAYGRGAGVWTAAGIGSGIFFHVGYGLFGLSWLTARYPQALGIIAATGVVFLGVMGFKALRSQPLPEGSEAPARPTPRDHGKFFAIGLLTNLLNAKAVVYFVALFTAVVTGATSALMKVVLGLWIPVLTFGWFCFVALTLGNPGVRTRLRRSAHWIDRAMGAVLLALAAAILRGLVNDLR